MRKIYFIAADKWGWSLGETDKAEFYMLEYLLEELEEKIDSENKRTKKQEDDYRKQSASFKSPSAPKVGSTDYGGFKIPKMPTPKLSMPKF